MPAQKNPPKELTTQPTVEGPKGDSLACEIGRRISQARNGLGLSQQAVSTRSRMFDPDGAGISRATLSLYETGTNKPGAREILLLCEVLSVSPNWLLFGSESPSRALQQTTLFLVGNDLELSTRLAMAILLLSPTDRDSLANIVYSMLTSKIGDLKVASLMTLSNLLKDGFQAEILKWVGDDAKGLALDQLLDRVRAEWPEQGAITNWGTLRPPITDEQFENDDLTFPPPRSLKDS